MKKLLLLFVLFCTGVVFGQPFTSSHLPIVIVNTGNATYSDLNIPDDPKVNTTFGIIDNGPGVINNLTDPQNVYSGYAGIETRGNSTQGYSKKTYSLELRTNLGIDTSSALLGMGKEEDWILHAMVIDKTQLRIPFSFDLARSMGHYASNWRYVELVVDNDYRGIYLLCEKIKRDDDRVDIARLDADDLAGDSLTGGYILRIDWLDGDPGFESNYYSMSGTDLMNYQYYYPKAINLQPAQANYIKGYMDSFEEAVFAPNFINAAGYRYNDYVDITSFVDFLIMNEFSKNSDGYKLSSYLHKDKDSKGGLLKAGPIWDFDQTYGMSDVCSDHLEDGWLYLQNQPDCGDHESMPLWWAAMMSDTVFTNHLACRWESLRTGPLHVDTINAWFDTHELFLGAALTRNFAKWLFIGEQIWSQPEPVPATYAEEISVMKSWIVGRLAWLDANMPGNCANDVVSITEQQKLSFEAYPNPAQDKLFIRTEQGSVIHLYSLEGAHILTRPVEYELTEVDVSNLSSGMYLIHVTNGDRVMRKKISIL